MRFPHYDEMWEKFALSDITQRVRRKNKNNETNLPLTVSAQYGLIARNLFFDRQIASKDMSNYYLLLKGEFAYNKSYSNDYEWGTVKRLDLYDMGALSSLYFCFSPKTDKVNSDWLLHYFETTKWHRVISDIAGEGARNHGLLNMSVEDYFATLHYLPKIKEQAKIADFFNLLTERIETQSKIIEDIMILKKSIIDKFFCDFGLFEKGKETRLRDILCEGSKVPVDTSQYKKITIKLHFGGLEYTEQGRSMKDTRPFYVRHKGELIIGKQNYFNGSIALVEDEFDGCICSNAIMSFIIAPIVNPVFLFHAVSNTVFLKMRAYYANGTGQKELSEKDFLNFSIKLPMREEQDKVADILVGLDRKLEIEKDILTAYKKQKAYLLSQMFI